jgi:hypothetical protein
MAGNVLVIAESYEELGIHLCIYAEEPAAALACHLAAALIRTLSSARGTDHTVFLTAFDMAELGTDATGPTDVADLCRQVGDIPGTDLHTLLAGLSPDPATAEQALRDLVAQAQALAATVSGELRSFQEVAARFQPWCRTCGAPPQRAIRVGGSGVMVCPAAAAAWPGLLRSRGGDPHVLVHRHRGLHGAARAGG